MNVVIAILILSIIIIVHEFGHFIIAKANNVCVVEFSIGFGPVLFSFRIRDTNYCIKALPFGGSCMMLSSQDAMLSCETEDLTKEEKRKKQLFNRYGIERTLESKSLPARIAILAAGPVFNFLLAFVISIFSIGFAGYTKPVIENPVNKNTVFKDGDEIVAFNGNRVRFANEILFYETFLKENEKINITYLRDGQEYKTTITPEKVTKTDYRIGVLFEGAKVVKVLKKSPAKKAGIKVSDTVFSINGKPVSTPLEINTILKENAEKEATLGIKRDGKEKFIKVLPEKVVETYYDSHLYLSRKKEKVSPIKTVYLAFCDTFFRITSSIDLVIMLISGKLSFNDLTGPVGTISAISTVVEQNRGMNISHMIFMMLSLCAILSANIGVMNLIPIPGLDGGRLLLYFIEALRRKKASKKVEMIVNIIGVIFLVVLMFVVLVKDIVNLF